MLGLAAVMLPAGAAHAWIETTVLGDDVRLAVERDGHAVVEHQVMMRVRGSPMRSFSLPGVDADAQPEGEAVAIPQNDGASAHVEAQVPIAVQTMPDGSMRLAVDAGQGLPRGTYLLKFRYRTDLVKSGALERDGQMVKLRWLGPRQPNGLDAAKTVVILPSAPTEPREGSADDTSLGSTGAFLTTTKRMPDRDEIELVRPHVARGEQVAWTVRLDPRSLSAVNDPRIRPPPAAAVQAIVRHESRERQVFLAVAAGVALLFTALTALKGKQVELASAAAGVAPRPVVQAGVQVRALLAGPTVALGVGMQLLLEPPVVGTVLLLAAMALMAHRTPLPKPQARGPGRWLPLSDEEAFRKPPAPRDAWLDISTRGGKLAFALALVAVGIAAWATWTVSPYHANLLVLDALMLVALFFTGRTAALVPSLATGPAALLQRAARELRREMPDARIVPWARFPQGEATHDELRLLVMPKAARRGLHGIEIGCSFAGGIGGSIACPEILVRVADETDAARHARSLAPFGRWVHGRRAGELVLAIEPRAGSVASVTALARQLCAELAEPSPPKASPVESTKKPVKAAAKSARPTPPGRPALA